MYNPDDLDVNYLGIEAARVGFSPEATYILQAAVYAISSGEVAIPIPQEIVENATMHDNPVHVAGMLLQYPEFIATAVQYMDQYGPGSGFFTNADPA